MAGLRSEEEEHHDGGEDDVEKGPEAPLGWHGEWSTILCGPSVAVVGGGVGDLTCFKVWSDVVAARSISS